MEKTISLDITYNNFHEPSYAPLTQQGGTRASLEGSNQCRAFRAICGLPRPTLVKNPRMAHRRITNCPTRLLHFVRVSLPPFVLSTRQGNGIFFRPEAGLQ